jgi:CBS domain-containing protein
MEIGPLISRQVLSVGLDHTLAETAKRMGDAGVGAAVVDTDEGYPGIITERDLLKAIADGIDLNQAKVSEHMTSTPVTASENWDVAAAAREMVRGKFRHLIVLDSERRVSGMLSIRDLVETLLDSLE